MFGSEAQKQRYVVPLAHGRALAAWGLTEAGSGSDAAAMRTTAVRDGDGWVLNGAKSFITHGTSADTLVVMAVTDRARGAKGISAFIVERGTPGLRAGKKEDKLGMRASETAEVLLEQCRVPADQLIGEEGQGFVQTLAGARRRPDRHRGARRRAGPGRLRVRAQLRVRAPAVRRRHRHLPVDSARSSPRMPRASRRRGCSRYRAAWLKDQGRRMTLESSMAKLFASEAAVRAAEDAVQIHGGYGFVKDYPAEKFFRDVKLTTIGEGTSEIQRLVIARQLLAAV